MEDFYSKTGISVIDIHHEKMLSVINELTDTVRNEECEMMLVDVFQKLLFYAENYFVEEEYLMQRFIYPEFGKHKNEHKNFVDELIKYQQLYSEGDACICKGLLEFLQTWYKKHIVNYDNTVVDFLKAKIIEKDEIQHLS